MANADNEKNAWERSAVFLRLTKRRKGRLAEICKALPPGSTPSDAVDAAIEMAAMATKPSEDEDSELADRVADLADSIERLTLQSVADRALIAQMQSSILSTERYAKSMLELISASADEEIPDDVSNAGSEIMLISDWLARQLDDRGLTGARVAVLKALLSGLEMTAEGLGQAMLSAELAAVDGAAIRSFEPYANIAIGGLQWGGPELCALAASAGAMLSIACQAKPMGGWSATVIAPNRAGKGNVQIAAFDIG